MNRKVFLAAAIFCIVVFFLSFRYPIERNRVQTRIEHSRIEHSVPVPAQLQTQVSEVVSAQIPTRTELPYPILSLTQRREQAQIPADILGKLPSGQQEVVDYVTKNSPALWQTEASMKISISDPKDDDTSLFITSSVLVMNFGDSLGYINFIETNGVTKSATLLARSNSKNNFDVWNAHLESTLSIKLGDGRKFLISSVSKNLGKLRDVNADSFRELTLQVNRANPVVTNGNNDVNDPNGR